jgi:hypothetical protein
MTVVETGDLAKHVRQPSSPVPTSVEFMPKMMNMLKILDVLVKNNYYTI